MNIQLTIKGGSNPQKEAARCEQAEPQKQTNLDVNITRERLKIQRRIERAMAAAVHSGLCTQAFAKWILEGLEVAQ
jgi:hypothetical protein